MTTKYDLAIIFTKRTNLLEWFDANVNGHPGQPSRQYCEQERDVQLILLARYDINDNLFCKIRCPINPLPIRGEFNAVSLRKMTDYLARDGWKFKQKVPIGLFQ